MVSRDRLDSPTHNPPRPGWSDTSQEGTTHGQSPISTTTPNSAPEQDGRNQSPYSLNSPIRGEAMLSFATCLNERRCSVGSHTHADARHRFSEPDSYPLRREIYAGDASSSYPRRPW